MVLFKFIDPIRTMRTEVMCANCGTMETPAWRFSEMERKFSMPVGINLTIIF